MTTFQSIIYAVIHGMSQFLPISAKTHHHLIPFLVGWQSPSGALLGALSAGTLLAILIYFRHDWASMISSFLQILIYRRRPRTLDERLPMFLAVSCIPIGIYFYMSPSDFTRPSLGILATSGAYALIGFALLLVDSWNRKNKGTFDWNWRDSAVVGIAQLLAVLPGGDPMTGILLGAFFLNYRREAAAKYAYFALTPLLVAQVVGYFHEIDFRSAAPMPDLSWLSFAVALIISFFASLLAIGGFMRHVQQKGMQQYVIYRWLLAAGASAVFWMRG